MEVNPLSIILVKSDSKGDRLLFRYPHAQTQNDQVQKKISSNYYAMANDDILQNPLPQTSNIYKGQLSGITDEVLSTLFAVKTELCNKKFELKVNDVRFVGHPTLMSHTKTSQNSSKRTSCLLLNIVFALHAQASYSIVKCYYELSKRLGLGLKFEEERVGYLTREMKMMLDKHDEVASIQEKQVEQQQPSLCKNYSAFDLIESSHSSLAQTIKTVYHDLCTTGLLNITINESVTLCFCLPQKAHQFHKRGFVIEPEAIDRSLQALKPYHGMLLLVDCNELLDCVPPSGARILSQLIEVYNPLKSLQNMASDSDLKIEHVYQLVGHLVYWAKATIIYPLCETNVYVIAPDAHIHVNSPLVDKFASKFPDMSLFEVISDFSLPTSIGHLTTPLQHPTRQGRLAQMVLWLLQHYLLMQLHVYVQFMPAHDEPDDMMAFDVSAEIGSGPAENGDDDDDENQCSTISINLNGHENSLPSTSSQPLAVPNTKNSYSEYSDSVLTSNILYNSVTQAGSSHKSMYSITQTSISTDDNDSTVSVEDEDKIKELLSVFDETDRACVAKVPAASNAEDLSLMVKLWQAGYFKGEHHLEEIMYFENLRRSQLLQLLDKFREILIIYETEDPAIASLYTQT